MSSGLPIYAISLRRALWQARMRQSELARAVGVSRASVSMWTRGLRRPCPATAAAIGAILDLDPKRFRRGRNILRAPVDSANQGA